jgi:hypothetical protein
MKQQIAGRTFRTAKPQISAMEVSSILFSAADGNRIGLARIMARQSTRATDLASGPLAMPQGMVDLLLARRALINARNLAGAPALYFAPSKATYQLRSDLPNCRRQPHWTHSGCRYAGSDAIVEARERAATLTFSVSAIHTRDLHLGLVYEIPGILVWTSKQVSFNDEHSSFDDFAATFLDICPSHRLLAMIWRLLRAFPSVGTVAGPDLNAEQKGFLSLV